MIIFTKDYKGPYGTFKKGDKWDPSADMQKQLPKDAYEVLDPKEPAKAKGKTAKSE